MPDPAPARRRAARASWHLRTGAVVAAWLVALVVVTVAHPFLPASRWLLVHLLTLGAVSNAVLVWSWHFAAALLRLPETDMRPGQVPRLVVFNTGAVVVVAGIVMAWWPLVGAGGLLVIAAAGWHAVALLARMRKALPSRFAVTVRYYVAAAALLPLGVVLGILLARGSLAGPVHARVVVAHAMLNVLGWIALTVVGTLVTLWPTMLRTRMAAGVERAAGRALPVLLGGLAVGVAGALAGALLATAAGALLFGAGVVLVLAPHRAELRQKAPTEFATASVLAGVVWLLGTLLVLAAGTATARDWSQAAERAGWLTAPLLVGFALQVLLGALTFLLPVVLGGGPARVRAVAATLRRGGPFRLAVINAGLLVCVLPVPSLVRVLASLVLFGALASFLPLAARAVVLARRGPDRVPTQAPGDTPARRHGLAQAVAGLAAVALAAAGGVAMDPVAAGLTSASPAEAAEAAGTGETTTVDVRIEGMSFVPDAVDVPKGNRLVVVLANTGDDGHDLVLATGARTPRVDPGKRVTLDAGVVTADVEGWCSLVGHRQVGMVLRVHAVDAVAGQAAAGPGAGFEARDARLDPATGQREHRITLSVQEVVREVAPGVTQRLWTFGGTAPGAVLRGRVGDVFDVTLVNDGSIGHSIDFHAGALAPDRPMRTIQPGESLSYRFTATRAGVWLYHCATAPVSLHVANGMFGAVIIDPPELPPVDREYLLVQSELYLGPDGDVADVDKLAAERPDLVVFNGYADQYGAAPLRAVAGERIRIWVLAAGPQRGSAFHVVGGQFDTVWQEGAYRLAPGGSGGSQVLGLAPAQGGFVELEFPEAGSYPFLTHALVDAERGARGVVQVASPAQEAP